MKDRLEWLLANFELRAHTFQAGPFSREVTYAPKGTSGYIHLLQQGSVYVTDEGTPTERIDAPSAFLYLNPTTTHIAPEDSNTLIVCATFEFGLGTGNPLQAALPNRAQLSLAQAPGLGSIMEQLHFEASEHHCGRQAILDRLCEVALVLILRDIMDEARLNVGLLAGLADEKLYKSLNAIHEDPATGWTIEGMAAVAGMSRARFAAHFNKVVGEPPITYLTNWRIGLAQQMLLDGKPVNVVADAVGYASASALSRVFQQRCSCSPREWLRGRR